MIDTILNLDEETTEKETPEETTETTETTDLLDGGEEDKPSEEGGEEKSGSADTE